MEHTGTIDLAELEASVTNFYEARPSWVTGCISLSDAHFLARKLAQARVETVVEIGTASGLSAGVICHVLNHVSQVGLITPDFKVITYDISRAFNRDRTKKTGDAAREQMPPNLIDHILFRNPATAADIRKFHSPCDIQFIFIDADHRHPWPTLDLLACLDCLHPDALVALHDINLPIVNPDYQDWGAKYLFDGLKIEKEADSPRGGGLYNIGCIRIPAQRESLRSELQTLLSTHKWETKVKETHVKEAGIDPASLPTDVRSFLCI